MKQVDVNLAGGRGYPVHIGAGALERAAEFAPAHCAVVTNPTIRAATQAQFDILQNALADAGKRTFVLELPDGEAHKNLRSVERLIDGFAAREMMRDGGVIAYGGGVIGDVAGYAAAAYMRGVALLQVPTTLLAMVDAAIGGKTGVNHASGKNLIGAFHQPRAVLADTNLLQTLPKREYNAGLAEVIKYGLLGDAEFFNTLYDGYAGTATRDTDWLEFIIGKSAQAKADIVVADETEQTGRRALLNLGHTFAHAVETTLGYGVWLHGEAVAFGLLAAAKLSEKICGFPSADTDRIARLLAAAGLGDYTRLPSQCDIAQLLAAMGLDKKNAGGEKRFILMRAVGDAFVGKAPDAAVREVLQNLQSD